MLCLFDLLLYSELYWYWISNVKTKKETENLIWGKPATPNYHFLWSCDNNWGRSPFYIHFIPNPGCLETLLPTVLFQEQYKCRKWLWKIPDKGVPHLSNRVTIFLENSEKFRDDFRDVWLVNSLIRPRRFSSSSETCGWTPAGNNL